jgi:hypothetical protein
MSAPRLRPLLALLLGGALVAPAVVPASARAEKPPKKKKAPAKDNNSTNGKEDAGERAKKDLAGFADDVDKAATPKKK